VCEEEMEMEEKEVSMRLVQRWRGKMEEMVKVGSISRLLKFEKLVRDYCPCHRNVQAGSESIRQVHSLLRKEAAEWQRK
jgi:hypothetical protein